MIREMQQTDIEAVVKKADVAFKQMGIVPVGVNNIRNTINIAKQCVASGVSFVSEADGVINGGLGAVIDDNYFCPSISEATVVALWVDEDIRGSSVFARLLSRFIKQTEGMVDRITLSHIPGFTNVDFSKLGFTLKQQIYTR